MKSPIVTKKVFWVQKEDSGVPNRKKTVDFETGKNAIKILVDIKKTNKKTKCNLPKGCSLLAGDCAKTIEEEVKMSRLRRRTNQRKPSSDMTTIDENFFAS